MEKQGADQTDALLLPDGQCPGVLIEPCPADLQFIQERAGPIFGEGAAGRTVSERSAQIAGYGIVQQDGTLIDQDFGYDLQDLVTKEVDLTNASPGETLVYTVTARYTGAELLSSVTLEDTIPTGTTYITDTDTPEATCGSCWRPMTYIPTPRPDE